MPAEHHLGAAIAHGLVDDAAVFPPGSASLPEAVRRHGIHTISRYRTFVGPLVVPASSSSALAAEAARQSVSPAVSFTFPHGTEGLLAVIEGYTAHGSVVGVEVAVPEGAESHTVDTLVAALAGTDVRASVEVPRGRRGDQVIDLVAAAGLQAKLRLGGVRADLYPDSAEVARRLSQVLEAGLTFKATAGLHHALRNTDPETGFVQHGFLNLLLAVHAVQAGEPTPEVVHLLEVREEEAVRSALSAIGVEGILRARATFTSFGCCDVLDPLRDLMLLGLLPTDTIDAQELS